MDFVDYLTQNIIKFIVIVTNISRMSFSDFAVSVTVSKFNHKLIALKY